MRTRERRHFRLEEALSSSSLIAAKGTIGRCTELMLNVHTSRPLSAGQINRSVSSEVQLLKVVQHPFAKLIGRWIRW